MSETYWVRSKSCAQSDIPTFEKKICLLIYNLLSAIGLIRRKVKKPARVNEAYSRYFIAFIIDFEHVFTHKETYSK